MVAVVSQETNPLIEAAVAVMVIAEVDVTVDAVSVETGGDVTADAVSVETEADVIQDVDVIGDVTLVKTEVDVMIVEIQDADVIQYVIAKAEMMKKSVQMNAIEKHAGSAPGMHTIEGRSQYGLGDIKAEIETIEVKT